MLFGADHVDWLLGQLGRSHAVHRAGRQVTLGHGPLEEGVQPAVAVWAVVGFQGTADG